MAKTILPRQNIVRGYSSGQAAVISAIKITDIPEESPVTERILLLEDEAETNLILKEYLQSLGYGVVAVTNGVEGLKEILKSPFELIICDMMMPRLPGDMFYLAVQKTRPELCNRFVFITGHQESPTVDAFIAKTHAAILIKPFRLHQLEVTLENVLSRFPKKIQATSPLPSNLKIIPNDVSIRRNDDLVAEKHRKAFDEPPPKSKEPTPSIVIKALRIVGFMRGDSKVVPPPLDPMPAPISVPPQTARITRRISDQPKVTRRIPELADKPICRPKDEAQNPDKIVAKDESMPVTQRQEPIRVSQKINAPAELSVRLPSTTSDLPKTTRKVKVSTEKATIRVGDLKIKAESPAKVTRKTTQKKLIPGPKITRQASKTTVRIAQTTVKLVIPALPKASRNKPAKAPVKSTTKRKTISKV